jgi:hypothetical protein
MLNRRLKEPFGKAGLSVAILALVLAMVGGAYAAGALTGKQKKEVEKIAKKFAGRPGTNGSPGAKGDPGAAGSNGASGAAGKSVVTSAAAVPGECPTGTTGTKFEIEGSGSPSHVCNGKNGKDGETGFTETLPEGKTETGTWTIGMPVEGFAAAAAAISFPIPLPEALPAEIRHAGAGPTTNCPSALGEFGQYEKPEAAPGHLCIYESYSENASGLGIVDPETFGGQEAGEVGVVLEAHAEAPNALAAGTWAVTAAE